MVSDKQKAKMHEAAQMQLFQMSDVKGELYKKQQAASRKQRAVVRERRSVCAEAPDRPLIRCRPERRTTDEKSALSQEKILDKELPEEGEIANGGFDDLLILANLAEVLESEGQYHREKSLHSLHEEGDVEVDKHALRVQGRVRLTQIRHQARLERFPPIQNKQSNRHEHAHLADTSSSKVVDADQVQEASGHQDVHDPCVFASSGSEGIKYAIKQDTLLEPVELNNEKLQQLPLESQLTIAEPAQMTTERGKLMVKQSDAHRLTQVRAEKEVISLLQEYRYTPLNHMGRSLSPVQILEKPKDYHYFARQSRRLRILKRRKQRCDAPFQSHELVHITDTNSSKGVDADKVQEASAHHDVQDPCVFPESGFKVTKDTMKQASLTESFKIINEKLEQSSAEPQVITPEPPQMMAEPKELVGQKTDAHSLTQASVTEPVKINNEGLQHPAVEPHEIIPETEQMNAECEEPREQQSDAHRLTQASVIESVEPHATISDPAVTTTELGEPREQQSDAHRLTQASMMERLIINNEELCQRTVEHHATIPDPTEITTDFGKPMEQHNDAHLLTEVSICERDVPVVSLLHEYGYARPNHIGQPLTLVQMLEEPKNCQYVARQRRRLRTFKRRKQRYDAQFRSTTLQTREMYEAHQWWLSHAINGQNKQKAKQQFSLCVSHVEREQQCVSTQQRREKENEERKASKDVNQQLSRPDLMEQSNYEGPQTPYAGIDAEEDTVPVEVNQSIQHLTLAKLCEVLQQQTTDVEDKEKMVSVKGNVRLTWLKRKARLRDSNASDMKKGKIAVDEFI